MNAGFNCQTFLSTTLHAPTYSIDGWYNNPDFPSAGSSGISLDHLGPAAKDVTLISDTYNITNRLFYIPSSNISFTQQTANSNQTAMFIIFAQLVFMDLVDVSRPMCPRQYLSMSEDQNSIYENLLKRVERSSEVFSSGESCIADWKWRMFDDQKATNWATGYLDGSSFYGNSDSTLRKIRSYRKGKVGKCIEEFCNIDQSTIRAAFQTDSTDFPHLNLYPHIHFIREIFLRWHNIVADKIVADARLLNKSLTDEIIFWEARRWTIATYQFIVEKQFLPILIENYSPSSFDVAEIKALSIFDSFAVAAVNYLLFRFPSTIVRLNVEGKCSIRASNDSRRLCEQPGSSYESFDGILDLLSSPIKYNDFTLPLDLKYFSGETMRIQDVMAIAIGRSRDHMLPTYMAMQRYFHPYTKIESWEDLETGCENDSRCLDYVDRLNAVYGDIESIDLIAGGLLNSGSVFQHIFKAQFENVIQHDSMWYSSMRSKQFTTDQLKCITETKLSTVLSSVLNISYEVRENPFLLSGSKCWKFFTESGETITLPKPSSVCKLFELTSSDPLIPVVLSLAGICVFTVIVVLCLYWRKISKYTQRKLDSGRKNPVIRPQTSDEYSVLVKEFIGSSRFNRKWRSVLLKFIHKDNALCVIDPINPRSVLRKILFFNTDGPVRPSASRAARRMSSIVSNSHSLQEARNKHQFSSYLASRNNYVLLEGDHIISLRVPADAHLVLKFRHQARQDIFTEKILEFTGKRNLGITRLKADKQTILRNCITKKQHQKRIESLLRAALIEATDQNSPSRGGLVVSAAFEGDFGAVPFEQILHMCEITLPELAELLRTDVNDKFTAYLFNYIDRERTGAVAYRDIVDFLAQISRGNDRDRLELLFKLYDNDGDGYLSFEEFATMLTSLAATGNQQISDEVLQNLFEVIVQENLPDDVFVGEGEALPLSLMTFNDLWRVFQEHESAINLSAVSLPGIIPQDVTKLNKTKPSVAEEFRPRENRPVLAQVVEEEVRERSPSIIPPEEMEKESSAVLIYLRSFVDSHGLEMFWGTIYIFCCFGLFALRFHESYSQQLAAREVAGVGVAIARASGLVINFTFSTMVALMARNVFTALRETSMRYYFPFDTLVEAHKFISVINLIASAVHIFSHVANFYHFSKLPIEDLWCLMPELKGLKPPQGHSTFVWLAYQTLTGLTGFLLVAVYIIIFAFAFGRSFAFRQFWITHQIWYLAATLLLLHGLGCLLQTPMFYAFFVIPAFLLFIDRVMSSLRKHEDLRVTNAKGLPSGVSFLEFEKPQGVIYIAGQWVRINVPECGNEYHPFTLTSAPHEPNMSLHILSVGPWTRKLSKLVATPEQLTGVRIEGPFGEGHQDWHRSDIAVLVGAGIGVTPFASILKHVSQMLSYSYMPYSCKKVYFFWITRNQKHFEWFTDIIRGLEEVDVNNFTSTHICITQFQSKFDFRTIMLYLCERHFQKLQEKSLFTGLKSKTHFGRPDFFTTLQTLKEVHSKARSIGVFTCGPPALIPTVERAVKDNNKEQGPLITHYYETF